MPIAPEILEAQSKSNDLEFFKERVQTMPLLIEWANEDIQNDKDILLAAVNQAGWTGCYASEALRDDKDVILAAVKNDGQILYFASERLRDDKDVVLAAIENKPIIIKYASLRLRKDKDVAKLAVSKGKKNVLSFLDSELQKDEEILNLL